MDLFKVKVVGEKDIDSVIAIAGGRRAHPDSDRRSSFNADYIIGNAVVELKKLDDDGLSKPERQEKLAELFGHYWPKRPVIVLDPYALPAEGLRRYKVIMRGPIKAGISHASKQLAQSRSEFPEQSCSVLFLINNGYTALSHNELMELAKDRARNDTDKIDVVVVAGCYHIGDGFESQLIFPMDQIVVHPDRSFSAFGNLHDAWQGLAQTFATDMIFGREGTKGPATDITFNINNITYVKPGPNMGEPSKFYTHGRPRIDTSGIEKCPAVATTLPDITFDEWQRLRKVIVDGGHLFSSYEAWLEHREKAGLICEPLKPLVPIKVGRGTFEAWRRKVSREASLAALRDHANDRFQYGVSQLLSTAEECNPNKNIKYRGVMALTEVIGRDKANDISHLAIVEPGRPTPTAIPLVDNARIRHEHALPLAAAYALREGIERVFWWKDQRYAWI